MDIHSNEINSKVQESTESIKDDDTNRKTNDNFNLVSQPDNNEKINIEEHENSQVNSKTDTLLKFLNLFIRESDESLENYNARCESTLDLFKLLTK